MKRGRKKTYRTTTKKTHHIFSGGKKIKIPEPEDHSATRRDLYPLSSYLNLSTQGQDAPGKNSLTQHTTVHYRHTQRRRGRASRMPAHILDTRRHTLPHSRLCHAPSHRHTPCSPPTLTRSLPHSQLSPPPLHSCTPTPHAHTLPAHPYPPPPAPTLPQHRHCPPTRSHFPHLLAQTLSPVPHSHALPSPTHTLPHARTALPLPHTRARPSLTHPRSPAPAQPSFRGRVSGLY